MGHVLRFLLLLVSMAVIIFIMGDTEQGPASEYHTKSRRSPYRQKARYVTIFYNDTRRLGNLLFAYASLLGIAKRNNKTVILPNDFPAFDVFDIKVETAPGKIINNYMMQYFNTHEIGSAFDEGTNDLPREYGVTLLGYYQSWKYFAEVKAEIRTQLTFKPHLLKQAKDFLAAVSRQIKGGEDVVYVGLHIRTGDTQLKWWLWFKGYISATKEYYAHAMDYFAGRYPNVVFIVCSNDIEWSRQNIHHNQVVFSNFTDPAIDLALLSLCNHTIISVGTFGWWAAWLANGETVYYDSWPRPGSILDKQTKKEEYFLPDWIPMS